MWPMSMGSYPILGPEVNRAKKERVPAIIHQVQVVADNAPPRFFVLTDRELAAILALLERAHASHNDTSSGGASGGGMAHPFGYDGE